MAEFNFGTLIRDANPVGKREFVGNGDIKDTYSFRLENDNNINIALTNMSANADVRLFRDFNGNGVRDTNDSQVSASTRFGNQPDSINVSSGLTNVDAGSYLIEVDRVGTVNTEYDLRVSTNAISKPSNLVTAETEVGTLTASRTFNEAIVNSDTSDTYHFAVNSSRNFRFNLSGLSGDMDIRLINDRNNDSVVDSSEIITKSIATGNQSESITQFLTPGSTYYLQVYQHSGVSSYNLNMTPV
ncbi:MULTISPECIES: pre-peptidase C-terminal domain-containing protein [unclassified Microcoleus]|uniref:pre-peptidase C-terminal domain-containing protein n=1 Tax=unclassified Microcoleus TaxID=2642155 RepID=UPI002FD26DD2